jgi:hypothetical protein
MIKDIIMHIDNDRFVVADSAAGSRYGVIEL